MSSGKVQLVEADPETTFGLEILMKSTKGFLGLHRHGVEQVVNSLKQIHENTIQ